ncbi:hypothetical protein TGVAND_244170 [Toxoplasma gondii VAND]|uniref:Transmembrane protein n=1 Tax=Toxoplasma gondii VAND TaxID=933077 RepID=A0A086PWF3_TOXGO|nr:hypothetical protein TGVAND_244170 [Toxoplasma gondii VAND]
MVAKRTVLLSSAAVAAATLFSRFSASAEEHELPTAWTSMTVASSRAPLGTTEVPHGLLPEDSRGGRILGDQNRALSPPQASEKVQIPTAVESGGGRGAAVENSGARPAFEERAEDREAGAKRRTPALDSSAEEAQVTRRRSAGLAPWAREDRTSPLLTVAVTVLAVAITSAAVDCVKGVTPKLSNAIDKELKELASRVRKRRYAGNYAAEKSDFLVSLQETHNARTFWTTHAFFLWTDGEKPLSVSTSERPPLRRQFMRSECPPFQSMEELLWRIFLEQCAQILSQRSSTRRDSVHLCKRAFDSSRWWPEVKAPQFFSS